MNTTPSTPYARIEIPFGQPFEFCCCPVCGKPAGLVRNDEFFVNACAHLEFLYIGEIGMFEHKSEAFESRLQQATTDESDFSIAEFQQVLERLKYGSSLLAIEVTHGGMACGPVWSTEVYGFSFGSSKEE